MNFNNIIGRPDVADAMLPDQISAEIVKATPQDSVVLARARRVAMSSKTAKQGVIAKLPEAYWLNGDTDLKQTSEVKWESLTMTAEELAVIVPIPDALFDDASVPLWEEVRPLVKEAIGKKIDQAVLFGHNKPDSWPTAIVPAAITAGNLSTLSPTNTLAEAFLSIAQQVATKGHAINGFVARPGLNWSMRGLKDNQGQYLFGDPTSGGHTTLFGQHLDEVRNGAWQPGFEAIALDWSKFLVGIRQDITYDLFKEGVISDNEGRVVLNLMQQDTKALRVVCRIGFAYATPVNPLGTGFPAGVILPTGN